VQMSVSYLLPVKSSLFPSFVIGQKYLQSLRGKGSNHNPWNCFISLRSIWLTPRNAYAMTLCN